MLRFSRPASRWDVGLIEAAGRGSDLRVLPDAHGAEAGVVAEVEVQVPLKRAVIGQYCPAPPADLITLVIALPAELHAVTSAVLARAAVHPPPDDDETELAGPVVAELDEAGRHQVDGILVPQVHLHDPPPAIQVHYSFLLGPGSSSATSVAVLSATDRGGSNPRRQVWGQAALPGLRPGSVRAACARAPRRRHWRRLRPLRRAGGRAWPQGCGPSHGPNRPRIGHATELCCQMAANRPDQPTATWTQLPSVVSVNCDPNLPRAAENGRAYALVSSPELAGVDCQVASPVPEGSTVAVGRYPRPSRATGPSTPAREIRRAYTAACVLVT